MAGTVTEHLVSLDVPHALIGGLAVSVRTEPRFTRDVDLVLAVDDDPGAERVLHSLLGRGLSVLAEIEQTDVGRIGIVRLNDADGQLIDLIFASSGIEAEIVEASQRIEIVPGFTMPVASTGHLIALKVLSQDDESRPQDRADLRQLLAVAGPDDLAAAETAVLLITARGYGRDRDLVRALADLQRGHGKAD